MTHDDPLPPLRDVIAEHQLRAKRALGQNFLLDLNLTRKIARLSHDLTQATVLEIGAGPGGLTRGLLMEGAKHIIAVERDERCLKALEDISNAYPQRLSLLSKDALQVDFENLTPPPTHIIANLPYNIGTELLIRWMRPKIWPPSWKVMSLMFQKEVAERIIAKPNSKAYGRLAVIVGCRADAKITMTLPPEAFTPAPKVSSAIVQITLCEHPKYEFNITRLEYITKLAFGQRRKMLRSSLKKLHSNIEAQLEMLDIDAKMRAENLTISEFCKLSCYL